VTVNSADLELVPLGTANHRAGHARIKRRSPDSRFFDLQDASAEGHAVLGSAILQNMMLGWDEAGHFSCPIATFNGALTWSSTPLREVTLGRGRALHLATSGGSAESRTKSSR